MTPEDAEKVIQILLKADGGCPYCVGDMLQNFGDEFPEFQALAIKAFNEHDLGKHCEPLSFV